MVAFPFDDLSGSKVRPAVCLTDVVGVHGHVVLAFITSAVPPRRSRRLWCWTQAVPTLPALD